MVRVVTVCHCASAVFPLQSARKRSEATAAPVYDVSQRRLRLRSLSPAAINAMLGLRLNRLLRDFEIGFGALHIQVGEDGEILTICPAPSFRPDELEDMARRLSALLPGSGAAGSALLEPNTRRKFHPGDGGRRHGGAK